MEEATKAFFSLVRAAVKTVNEPVHSELEDCSALPGRYRFLVNTMSIDANFQRNC